MRHGGRGFGAALASVAVLGLLVAAPANAQRVNSKGQAPVTDVSGTAITSGDMVSGLFVGAPGPVQAFTCAAATGVRNEGVLLTAELERESMWVVVRTPGHRLASAATGSGEAGSEERQMVLPESLQADLLALLFHEGRGSEPSDRIAAGLTPPSNDEPAARASARQLAGSLGGLLAAAGRMDVHDPGHETATRLTRAVARYNAFVNAGSEAFLADPAVEFLAMEAVLSRLVVAALDYDGDPDACGGPLPDTAPPPAPAPPPPPPPAPERVISVCVWTDDDLRDVAAIHLPLSGETYVVVGGERRPFSEVHPGETHRRGAELADRDDPIALSEREYVKFGVPHAVGPDGMVRGGEFEGVPVFHEREAESPPAVIYVPVGEGCLAQPYELQEEVRQVRG